jgi:hypothetical protein
MGLAPADMEVIQQIGVGTGRYKVGTSQYGAISARRRVEPAGMRLASVGTGSTLASTGDSGPVRVGYKLKVSYVHSMNIIIHRI